MGGGARASPGGSDHGGDRDRGDGRLHGISRPPGTPSPAHGRPSTCGLPGGSVSALGFRALDHASAVLALVGRLGGALQKTATGEIQRRGMFAAMSAMMDPNTQRALGFGLAFASQLGQALDESLPIEG